MLQKTTIEIYEASKILTVCLDEELYRAKPFQDPYDRKTSVLQILRWFRRI